MDKKPKISCIMAVYNTEEYLDEAIQSILNQTYRDFEFIISDDGSTDKSKEIIKKYENKDKRIIFLDNKVNRGIIPNLIDCIDKASGDYIAIMESDDVSYSERFELEIQALDKDSTLYLVGGDGNIIDEKGNIKYNRITYKKFEEIKEKCLFQTPFNTPGIMFRKELGMHFKNIKYPNLRDNDLYLNTIFLHKRCINIPNFIIKKRELEGSLFYRKYLKIQIQHISLRLHIAKKYKLYKKNKFIFLSIIGNVLKDILYHYFVFFTKKVSIYEPIKYFYHSYIKH